MQNANTSNKVNANAFEPMSDLDRPGHLENVQNIFLLVQILVQISIYINADFYTNKLNIDTDLWTKM